MENSLALNKGNFFLSFIKGVLVSLCVTIAGIFLFALVLKFVNVSTIVIKIVNQIIKVISVLFGVKICLKQDRSKGLLKGFIVGVFYTIFSYLIFSFLVSSFSFGLNLLYDVLFSGLTGIVCGVIFVNSKLKSL